jgi:hypothetical protein
VRESDLDISVVGNLLTITGKREAESREEHESWYAMERSYGAFTLAHAGNVRGLPYVLLGGIVLGVLREVSGSVLVSLAAHVAYNGVEVGSLLASWLPSVSDAKVMSPLFAALGTVATIVLLVLAAVLGRKLASSRLAREEDAR